MIVYGPFSGNGLFTTTVVVAVFEQVPFETVTVYVPALANAAGLITGFCTLLL